MSVYEILCFKKILSTNNKEIKKKRNVNRINEKLNDEKDIIWVNIILNNYRSRGQNKKNLSIKIYGRVVPKHAPNSNDMG